MKSYSEYEIQTAQFKPTDVKEKNTNDVRAFVYDFFAHFDHIATGSYFTSFFDPKDMAMVLPNSTITNHDDFLAWYDDWIKHCPWDFHSIHDLQITGNAKAGFGVSFLVHHTGEWVGDETQFNKGMKEGYFNNLIKEHWKIKVVDDRFYITWYQVL